VKILFVDLGAKYFLEKSAPLSSTIDNMLLSTFHYHKDILSFLIVRNSFLNLLFVSHPTGGFLFDMFSFII